MDNQYIYIVYEKLEKYITYDVIITLTSLNLDSRTKTAYGEYSRFAPQRRRLR